MSFWSGLGKVLKVAAPIATAFIPGLGPIASMLLSGGIGAGTGALGGGGAKGALIGGLMGAGSAGVGSLIKGSQAINGLLGKAGTNAVASAAGTEAAGGINSILNSGGTPNIPTTSGWGGGPVPDILTTSGWGGTAPSGGTPTLGWDGSVTATDPTSGISDKLKGVAGNVLSSMTKPNGLLGLGAGLSGVAQAQASNRGTALDAMMEGDKMRLTNQQAREQQQSDLWRKLQAVDYMKSGGNPKQDNFSSTGLKIPAFNFGPAPISEANKQMARDLEPELQDQLKNPLKLSDYNSKLNPSGTEKTLDWLGPILSGIGYGMQPQGQGVGAPKITTPLSAPNPTVRRPTGTINPYTGENLG